MDITEERRRKYMKKDKQEKINVNFNLVTLEIMSSYVISDNKNIRRSNLVNMKNLFDIIDMSNYVTDPMKMKYVNFINKVLEAKLVKNLNNASIIEKYINGGIIEDNIDNEDKIDISTLTPLQTQDVEFVSNTVSESLKYSYIYNDMDKLYDILLRFRTSDYINRGSIVGELEQQIIDMNNLFRKARVEKAEEVVFSLKDGVYENAFREIHQELTSPSCRLYSGMQGLNKLIGGAFETGRTYIFLGLAGAGKSMTLLNLAKQLKDNNKHYRTKDPTKKPCIVILTMENSVKETVDRLFEISTGEDMKKLPVEEAMEKLKKSGMIVNEESPIDIIIKYVPNRSIDTSYLYTLYEDLEDEGYEMICLIQDHIKRIRSIEKTTEIRFELGNVMNEFKTFSILKNCVMITNGHLNRDAAKSIDDGQSHNKKDLIKTIGRANTGESLLMIDNTDMAIVINQEMDADGTRYIGFKRVKERVKVDPTPICFQPLKENSMCLIEDLHLRVPLHKESLVTDNMSLLNNGRNAIDENKYNTFENKPNDDLDLFSFNSGDRYGSIPMKQTKKRATRKPKLIYKN